MNVESRLKELIGEPAGPAAHRPFAQRPGGDRPAPLDPLGRRPAGRPAAPVQRALIDQAEAGADLVMPGYTHLQAAQPVTFGHHMLAYVEMFGATADAWRTRASG